MNTQARSTVERRAVKARLSACLLGAFGVLAVLAPAALAVPPKTPALTGTNPPSPSTATKPFIQGESDEVITTIVGPRAQAFGPVTRAEPEHPEYIVTIYADDATCTNPGAIAAEGTAAELEGVGIQVDEPVALDWTTTFHATQTDPLLPAEPSKCSIGLRYQQVNSPPAAPDFTATVPASPADDNQPRLTGTAAEGSAVEIYDNSECFGSPIATGSAVLFGGEGIQVGVANNTTTDFYAVALLAGFESGCSTSTIAYQEVTPEDPGGGENPGGGNPGGGNGGGDKSPPKNDPPGKPSPPKLRTSPGGTANDNTPVLFGKAPGAVRVKIYGGEGCNGPALAEGSVGELNAGIRIQVADDTTSYFYGVSVDGGGDRSACASEPAVYVEDSTAPQTRITSAPSVRTRRRVALFRFADITGDTAVSFVCRLDKRRWRACKAPLKLKKLGHRRHLLRVKSVDAAGNRELKPVKRRFQVIR